VNGELEKYQRKLGTPPRRPHLSVIKSYDLEPVQQPDETTSWWERVDTSTAVVIGCVVYGAAIALAEWLFKGGLR
jgi:hypothetical protein